jgi:hypothetical protein
VIDPPRSSRIRVEQYLKATIKNETVITTCRLDSPSDVVRGFKDVDRYAGFKQCNRRDESRHASANDDDGMPAGLSCSRPGRV